MTWNIHGGRPARGSRDLERVVSLVQRHAPDIVALQEVDSRSRATRTSSDPAAPAFEFLREALGSHAAEVKLVTAPDGEFGHVVLSRWPMSRPLHHDISFTGREPRAMIETSVTTPFGNLHLIAAHFGLSFRERRHQSALLAKRARSAPECCVVLGDFNDWLWRGSVQRKLAVCTADRTHHKTFPAWHPLFALDRVYCRPAVTLVRSWTDRAASDTSDHLPVVADLAL